LKDPLLCNVTNTVAAFQGAVHCNVSTQSWATSSPISGTFHFLSKNGTHSKTLNTSATSNDVADALTELYGLAFDVTRVRTELDGDVAWLVTFPIDQGDVMANSF
jgi:hypothetical protein